MRGAGRIWGAAALFLALGTAAEAQSKLPPPAIVVVDMMEIMRDAKAAKNVQTQVQDEMNAYTKEVARREDELKQLSDQLERQRTALAPDVFAARSQEYQQRYTALDHDVQGKRQAMQQSYSEAMTKIENTALQIVADVARERNANMVVAKAALLYMADGIDVTAEVTRRLDAKLPSVAVNLPKEEGQAPKPPGRK